MARWPNRLLRFSSILRIELVLAEYFRSVDPKSSWHPPRLQPWDPLRATNTTVLVSWTHAKNDWSPIGSYELEARRPASFPLAFSNSERLQHRGLDTDDPNWPRETELAGNPWTNWTQVYRGLARLFTVDVNRDKGHAVQLRVRACGPPARNEPNGCSQWSEPQTAHTVLSASVDQINFFIRGTGKNSPDHTIIEVNNKTIYSRRDRTGLVMAVFSLLDMSLQWLRTYDTHRNADSSRTMSKDLRRFNHTNVVFIASTIAWEWHATRALAKQMQYCGAFHFGQWSHIFAEQPHYHSPDSDLDQSASQQEFSHPYAFVGIPGLGTGMGYESLMLNTGHYLAKDVNVPKAIIRGKMYYDYVARVYRLHGVQTAKADFFTKNEPPKVESFHNPVPSRKHRTPMYQIGAKRAYTPYVGTLQKHLFTLIETNNTVPPFNYGFLLITSANVYKVDPRPRRFRQTELERLWNGASARYWPDNPNVYNGSVVLNGTLLFPGVELNNRLCPYFVYHGFMEVSPENITAHCGDCCNAIDSPGLPIVQCDIGVAPTICRNLTNIQLYNTAPLNGSYAYPYEFRVIDPLNWVSHD